MKYGFFMVSTLGICVPLYLSEGNAQEIIDKENSAVIIETPNFNLVCDHNSQCNFQNLKNTKLSTKAQIIKFNSIENYICTGIELGKIITTDKNRLYDSNEELITKKKNIDLCVYTCQGRSEGNVTQVYLTFWRKVE